MDYEQDQFFLHLPSNSSDDFYPNNTKAEFTTRLLHNVELSGNWECGISEILFDKRWLNVPEDEKWRIVFRNSVDTSDSNRPINAVDDITYYSYEDYKDRTIQFTFIKGFYSDPYEVLNEINAKIEEFMLWGNIPYFEHELNKIDSKRENRFMPQFRYDKKTDRIEAKLPLGIDLYLSDNLHKFLGYSPKPDNEPIKAQTSPTPNLILTAEKPMNFNYSNLDCFYVYCDLLEYVRVGHTEVPLLRIIDAGKESPGYLVKRHYNFPIYAPVQKKSFQQIEVRLLTDQNEPVPFIDGGKVIIILHFKRTSK